MGTFTILLQVGDLAGQQFIDIKALVDTGATYTVLPKGLLDQLGIAQEGQRRFELGDHRVVAYPIGYARLRLEDDQAIVLVVFGPEGIDPLLGATALEHLSLAVDPVHQRLIPVPRVAEIESRLLRTTAAVRARHCEVVEPGKLRLKRRPILTTEGLQCNFR